MDDNSFEQKMEEYKQKIKKTIEKVFKKYLKIAILRIRKIFLKEKVDNVENNIEICLNAIIDKDEFLTRNYKSPIEIQYSNTDSFFDINIGCVIHLKSNLKLKRKEKEYFDSLKKYYTGKALGVMDTYDCVYWDIPFLVVGFVDILQKEQNIVEKWIVLWQDSIGPKSCLVPYNFVNVTREQK